MENLPPPTHYIAPSGANNAAPATTAPARVDPVFLRNKFVQPNAVELTEYPNVSDAIVPGLNTMVLHEADVSLARDMYLSENTFRFMHIRSVNAWLDHIGQISTPMRKIHVDVHEGRGLERLVTMIRKRLRNLEELTVGIDEVKLVRLASDPEKNGHPALYDIPTSAIDRQWNFLLLRIGYMDKLRNLRFQKVEFTALKSATSCMIPHNGNWGSEFTYLRETGAIPGGILETVVAKEMMGPSLINAGRKRKAAEMSDNDEKEANPSSTTDGAQNGVLTSRPSSNAVQEPDSFPFFDLVPEIRNMVYEYVVKVDGKINPSKREPTSYLMSGYKRSDKTKYRPGPIPESALAVLLANKKIYEECVGLYYSRNDFIFFHPHHMIAFLVSLSDVRKNAICNITLHYHNEHILGLDTMETALSMLFSLPELRSLELVLADVCEKLRRNYSVRDVAGKVPGSDLTRKLRTKGVDVKVKCLTLERLRIDHRVTASSPDQQYQNALQDLENEIGLRESRLLHLQGIFCG